jgi:uncharacterized protein
MIERSSYPTLIHMLNRHAAVGLVGPRQVGKTTMALAAAEGRNAIYLDLEDRGDLAKVAEPELFFAERTDQLIILDEIQRTPDLFATLRGQIDKRRRAGHKTGQFLILGSASPELLKQSAESLAGRIAYLELGPLSPMEVGASSTLRDQLWLRGGFPESFLAPDDATSLEWRDAFIKTYLERDIPQFGPRIPAEALRRFWTMLAHTQGGLFNASRLATSLSVSSQTVARYLDLMVDLLLVRRLPPWSTNAGKRLVKSPKVYVRDCGLAHALLGIERFDNLLAHPIAGHSWEGLMIEALISAAPRNTTAYFYRTSAGAEIDLLLCLPDSRVWAIEFKRTLAPKLEKGFHFACDDLKPDKAFCVYPGAERFPLTNGVTACSVDHVVQQLSTI